MPTHRPLLALRLSALSVLLLAGPALSVTDISHRPLITNQVSVKPNLMFILDNSGSMDFGYVPEEMGSTGQFGYRSAQCNGAAYNPNITYPRPVTPDGREFPAMSHTAAWWDGFNPLFNNDATYSISNTVNSVVTTPGTSITVTVTGWPSTAPFAVNNTVALRRTGNNAQWITGTVTSITTTGSSSTRNVTISLQFSSIHDGSHSDWRVGRLVTYNLTSSTDTTPRADYYYRYKGTRPAMSWTYLANGSVDTSSTFVQECRSAHGTSPGNAVFDQIMVSSLSASQQQNYANWYSYYRKRILMMRSSAGRAIASLDSSYRIGFNTLNNGSNYNSTVTDTLGLFSNIRDFDASQRVVFYSNLYSANIQGGTPLRRSLNKIGQYYANAISGQTDPIQHACQRNYTLLTSDGYWNDSSTTPTRPSTLQGGGTAIGNQDGDISDTTWTPRPVYDGTGDTTRVEQRFRYVNAGACGFLNLSTRYQRILEQRTVIQSTLTGNSDTGWVAQQSELLCGSIPSPNPSAVTVVSNVGGGQSNTLADIAAYYYKTDLRPNMSNSVFTSSSDPASHQHMTTYTLGLGLSGVLRYDPNYLNQTTGDFADIKNGIRQWPVPPIDQTDHPAKVDDLWHAAVNGRGRYFSASDPQALTDSLSSALSDINAREGVGAAAASSTLRPVLGTDQIFLGSYRTRFWDGELEARTITRLANGDLSAGPNNKVWSASAQLNATLHTNRTIYYLRRQTTANGVSTGLAPFTFANISSDTDASTLLNHFNRFCDQSTIPTQCPALNPDQQTAARGANLVNFLRGDRSLEGSLYRTRESVLGDIVDASPVFVGPPPFNYTAQDYPSYKAASINRCPMVYVAANDGMLHAFSAKTDRAEYASCPAAGTESWAYVPRAVMPQMYLLADRDYANNHRFFVNATPVVGDIGQTVEGPNGDVTTWKTILVGGFGAGGRGYYALDITSPNNPNALWEFSDSDMGLSYGNPIITQIADAEGDTTWVVAFTSGLNNSGNGFLYILNAHTGALMYKVPTLVNGGAVGTAASPSGLNKLNAWIESPSYNLTLRFYAGDMKGNLWRFDANNLTPPPVNTADTRAVRLANLAISGTAQPITIRPELAQVSYGGYRHPVVLVGTGRYLGISDVETTARQSIYAIKDPLTSTGWGNVRPNLIEQTLSAYNDSAEVRTLTKRQVDWNSSTVAGWYIDLPDEGERVVTNMGLAFTTLSVASLIPKADVCSGDGYSWVYNLDIGTGSYVNEGPVAGQKSDQAVMGISIVQVVDGDRNETVGLNTKSTGETSFNRLPDGVGGSAGLRRTSWRELLPSGQ